MGNEEGSSEGDMLGRGVGKLLGDETVGVEEGQEVGVEGDGFFEGLEKLRRLQGLCEAMRAREIVKMRQRK